MNQWNFHHCFLIYFPHFLHHHLLLGLLNFHHRFSFSSLDLLPINHPISRSIGLFLYVSFLWFFSLIIKACLLNHQLYQSVNLHLISTLIDHFLSLQGSLLFLLFYSCYSCSIYLRHFISKFVLSYIIQITRFIYNYFIKILSFIYDSFIGYSSHNIYNTSKWIDRFL